MASAKPESRHAEAAAKNSAKAQTEVVEVSASLRQNSKAVLVSDSRKLKVPSLVGLPVRRVIEQAEAAGLAVQITGNGTVREQAPSAGTMVAMGTQVVVHCTR
jgi:cell division protein FtsI (penicillin-binding protein 3)